MVPRWASTSEATGDKSTQLTTLANSSVVSAALPSQGWGFPKEVVCVKSIP